MSEIANRITGVDKVSDNNQHFDLVVIGAGINGLGIARDAAERGLKVCLIEQYDICSGVSAWSGRLVHGGLRYLEHLDIKLVRESLRERERLFKLAPHLVKPEYLIMPFYKRNKRQPWLIALGMLAYDFLSFDKSVPWHRILGRKQVLERFPAMNKGGLSGAALFIDGQVEYAERLCVEIAVAASEAGCVIMNHQKVTRIRHVDGSVSSVLLENDHGDKLEIQSEVVINAGGPWVDLVNSTSHSEQETSSPRLIGGSKGSHIIVDPFPGAPDDVVYYESQADGRLVLVIPWMGRYLIGTTDILFDDDPDSARADVEEISYLLSEVNTLIPEAGLKYEDILYTYSGVRPLPYMPGVSEWKIPRSHIVYNHKKDGISGLYSIVSGKLTTYRQLAEDAVDLAMKENFSKFQRTKTKDAPFPGARDYDPEKLITKIQDSPWVSRGSAERLVSIYGSRCLKIVDMANENSELSEKFDPDSDAIAAELIFAVRFEFAKDLTDVMARRSLLAFEPGHGLRGARRAAEILGAELGWDEVQIQKSLDNYKNWLDHLRIPSQVAR